MSNCKKSPIKNYKLITILVMSFLYVFIGVKHFVDPQYFINITPPQIEYKSFAVYFTGVLEVAGGLLILNKKTRKMGAYTLIFLLIIVFPANIYIYLSQSFLNKLKKSLIFLNSKDTKVGVQVMDYNLDITLLIMCYQPPSRSTEMLCMIII